MWSSECQLSNADWYWCSWSATWTQKHTTNGEPLTYLFGCFFIWHDRALPCFLPKHFIFSDITSMTFSFHYIAGQRMPNSLQWNQEFLPGNDLYSDVGSAKNSPEPNNKCLVLLYQGIYGLHKQHLWMSYGRCLSLQTIFTTRNWKHTFWANV